MTPIHLAPIAATISGLAATASLIYVGVQTRVSVRHAGAMIHQGAAARTTTILLRMMEPENVAAWIEGNGETPTPELIRKRQFRPCRKADVSGLPSYPHPRSKPVIRFGHQGQINLTFGGRVAAAKPSSRIRWRWAQEDGTTLHLRLVRAMAAIGPPTRIRQD